MSSTRIYRPALEFECSTWARTFKNDETVVCREEITIRQESTSTDACYSPPSQVLEAHCGVTGENGKGEIDRGDTCDVDSRAPQCRSVLADPVKKTSESRRV